LKWVFFQNYEISLFSKQEMGFMKISLRWGLSRVKVALWFGSLSGGGSLPM